MILDISNLYSFTSFQSHPREFAWQTRFGIGHGFIHKQRAAFTSFATFSMIALTVICTRPDDPLAVKLHASIHPP